MRDIIYVINIIYSSHLTIFEHFWSVCVEQLIMGIHMMSTWFWHKIGCDTPEVSVLRDRIVGHLKWTEKLVCVHSCCSVCSTNEVHGSVTNYYLYDDVAEVLI
jgi:hypothetical protein